MYAEPPSKSETSCVSYIPLFNRVLEYRVFVKSLAGRFFFLQANVPQGDRVRRVYDVAQTPLQRLLASGVLPEDRQRDLSERVQQIDPLVLSEYLDALRHALLCGAHLPPAVAADGPAWPQLGFSLAPVHPSHC